MWSSPPDSIWGSRADPPWELDPPSASSIAVAATAPASTSAPRFLPFPVTTAKACHRRGRLITSSAPSQPLGASLAVAQPFRSLAPFETTVLVTGATGYIGCYIVCELLCRSHRVLAVARPRGGLRGHNSPKEVVADLAPARVVFSEVTDPAALLVDLSQYGPIHAAVCCLASRGGGVQNSWCVDYRATLHTLQALHGLGAVHFVLLSVVCNQKPLLEFQRAKIKFEDELAAEAARDPAFTYSIVRPTAFFKSLGGPRPMHANPPWELDRRGLGDRESRGVRFAEGDLIRGGKDEEGDWDFRGRQLNEAACLRMDGYFWSVFAAVS